MRGGFGQFRVTPKGITARLTAPKPWRPMTDAEWDRIMHIMIHVHPDRGRFTVLGARRSLDACFHAACMDGPWRALPEHYGKWGTVARLFRRWTHAGLWKRMLAFVAEDRVGLEHIQYYVCRAFRRAWRIHDHAGLTFARKLGMDSALRAASWELPDANLSQYLQNVLWPRIRPAVMEGPRTVQRRWLGFLRRLHTQCMGRRWLPRVLRLSWQEEHDLEMLDAHWDALERIRKRREAGLPVAWA
jgi:transposase